MHDPVNHPDHYTQHPSGVECIDITEQFNFNRGNAIKYIWRAGTKIADSVRAPKESQTDFVARKHADDRAQELEDLKKARWYLDREITRLGG